MKCIDRLFVLALACHPLALAAQSAQETWIKSLFGSAIDADPPAFVHVHDPEVNYMISYPGTARFDVNSTEAVVVLRFDDADHHYYNDWTLSVDYELTRRLEPGTPVVTTGTLQINYDESGDAYTDIDLDHFADASWASLKVTGVTMDGNAGAIPGDVYLDLRLEVNRRYELGGTEVPAFSVKDYNADDQTVTMRWDYVEGAVAYDMEWLFVDAGDPETSGIDADYAYDMKNATRITTTMNHYDVPVVYPRGNMLFRVRAIGNDVTGKRIEGAWQGAAPTGVTSSYPQSGPLRLALNEGFEHAFNWQYSANFSEQGKRKEVISYFDGSLRSRQSVTVQNTNTFSLIDQKVYDYLGRPSLQLLPWAVDGRSLMFRPEQSLIAGTDFFDYEEFDKDANVTSPEIFPAAGPGAYYTAGAAGIGPLGGLTPDAEGYPFVRTTYANDGSGRVKSQSQPGPTLRTGSGHTTRYFYGTPGSQWELDRLFGNEVGFVEHYKKSFQIDPNGVTSVSYTDQQGRVIATALAGEAPGSMEQLDTYSPGLVQSVVSDLKEFNTLQDGQWRVSNTFVLPNASDLDITYGLQPADFSDCITRDCQYDLSICLFNEGHIPIDINTSDPDQDCRVWTNVTSVTTPTIHLDDLPAGEYTVEKVLSLNQGNIATNETYIIENDPCGIAPVAETPGCDDCESLCENTYMYVDDEDVTHYVDEDGVVDETNAHPESYYLDLIETCISECEAPIEPPDPCEQALIMLSLDMSPDGQYFDNMPDQLLADGSENPGYDRFGWLTAEFFGDGSAHFGHMGFTFDSDPITTWQGIADHWQDEWVTQEFTQTVVVDNKEYNRLLEFHPEYCQYALRCEIVCKVEEGVGVLHEPPVTGDTFYGDYYHAMHAAVNVPYSASAAPQYYNPLGMAMVASGQGYQPFAAPSGSMLDDELVACWELANTCTAPPGDPDSDVTIEVSDQLEHFLPDGNGGYFSIWAVMMDPSTTNYHSASTLPTGLSQGVWDYINALHGNTALGIPALISTTPTGNQITPYQFFRNHYDFFREYFAYKAFDGGCFPYLIDNKNCRGRLTGPELMDPLTADGFIIRYPYNPVLDNWIPGTNSNADYQAFGESQTDEACEDQCHSTALGIVGGLTCIPETTATAVVNALVQDLEAICMLGCSADNPGGTDGTGNTTAITGPGSADMYNFSDVIEVYSNFYGWSCPPPAPYPTPMPDPEDEDAIGCPCSRLTDLLLNMGYDPFGTIGSTERAAIIQALADMEDGPTTLPSDGDVQDWFTLCSEPSENTVTDLMNAHWPDILWCITPQPVSVDCDGTSNAVAAYNNEVASQQILQQAATAFTTGYTAACFDGLMGRETFTMSYSLNEYHYMLYYYDQAGNLVKTVPPAGVDLTTAHYLQDNGVDDPPTPWTGTQAQLQDVIAANREHPDDQLTYPFIRPGHAMATGYSYNSYQQPVRTSSPDGGSTQVWYDRQGRAVLSRTAQQEADNRCTYSLFDENGRPTETGELTPPTPIDDLEKLLLLEDGDYPEGITDLYTDGTARTQITRTWYDTPFDPTNVSPQFGTAGQVHVRARVASTTYLENATSFPIPATAYDQATHYSYDIHGNVATLLQEFKELAGLGQSFKRVDYEYDLVSGNTNAVHYQTGQWDQFHHKYRYDADNRLLEVRTSRDQRIWDRDARYFYYAHGPLARTEIGDKQVQGTDNYYTLQGWLKGVNTPTLDPTKDPGGDGMTTGLDRVFAEDANGFALGYFPQDYQPVQTASMLPTATTGAYYSAFNSSALYNGNIPTMLTALRDMDGNTLDLHASVYRYDVLNRIRQHDLYIGDPGPSLNAFSTTGKYGSEYHFDANGNFRFLDRNQATAQSMDAFKYWYYYWDGSQWDTYSPFDTPLKPGRTNKLAYVADSQSNDAVDGNDLDNGQTADNYDYDLNGRLIKDLSASIDLGNLTWNLQNKVRRVDRTGPVPGTTNYLPALEFRYGPGGQRTEKIVKQRPGGTLESQAGWDYTYYVHDAQGNPLAIYSRSFTSGYVDHLYVKEHLIYGSKRLGEDRPPAGDASERHAGFTSSLTTISGEQVFNAPNYGATQSGTDTRPNARALDYKRYELTDHLGNVFHTLTDRRIASADINPSLVHNYQPDIVGYSDYYPYGSLLPQRFEFETDGYRFGFQGQEKDDEVHGVTGTCYAFEYRMNDPRVGRFLSIDPLAAKYPWNSPYAFAENAVIQFVELEGLEKGVSAANSGAVTCDEAGDGIIDLTGATGNTECEDHQTTGNVQSVNQEAKGLPVYSPYTLTQSTPGTGQSSGFVPNYLLRGTLLGAALFSPLEAGGGASVLPWMSPTGQALEEWSQQQKDKELVLLYRGVSNNSMQVDPKKNNSFQYETALLGMAVPRGLIFDGKAQANPLNHTLGATKSSLFTSWTMDETVARDFAQRGAPGGIVLSKLFPKSVLRASTNYWDQELQEFEKEQEVLILGVQRGAQVEILH